MKKLNICSLNMIREISPIRRLVLSILSVAFIVNGFFIYHVSAEEITTEYKVVSGIDSTGVETIAFSEADIKSLSAIDKDRIRNNGESWSQTGSYDEGRYLEFLFDSNIPSGATINSVIIKNNFRRDLALTEAKLEIWNGSDYIDQNLTICASSIDCDEEIDITSYINTPDLLNNLTVRFLAYREGEANTKTSHDYIGLIVKYEEKIIIPDEPAFFTEVIGDIEEDTYWTKDKSPYVVKDDLFVTDGSTLFIEEGVVVKIDQGKTIVVDGKIEARGTPEFPIYFTSLLDDSLMGDSNEDGDTTSPWENDWAYVFIDSPDGGSILNNTIVKYSSLGLVLYNAGSNDINSLISDKTIVVIDSDATFNYLKIPSIEIFENSNVIIDNSVIKNNEHYSVSVYRNSKLNLSNTELYSDSSSLVIISENSLANVSNLIINSGGYRQTPFSVYNNSDLNISNSEIFGTYNGFEIFNTGKLIANNLNLNCSNDGVVTYNDSFMELNKSNISCLNNGISLYSNGRANIQKSVITDAMNVGVFAYDNPIPSEIFINDSEITNNNYGFVVYDSTINANNNSIHDNLSYGAYTFVSIDLDFSLNYWGDASGPTHSSSPLGIGNTVSDNIIFNPFLETDPLLKASLPNIMFIPGFQGSRLYQMRDSLGLPYEDKLWEPNASEDLPDMNMDLEGESINEVYTKDVIKSATVFGIEAGDYYKSFMGKLDDMIYSGEINDWKAIPYDWRYSPIDVVNRGIEKDGKISYAEVLSDDQIPYIISQLQQLVETSKNGKVTIITHSNGGLVAKALINKLEKMKLDGEGDLVDKIDNLITVVPPQLGTPKALVGILHGYDQGVFHNILVGRKNARDLGQNSPGAYTLIPSQRYISDINNSLITLEESLDKINNWRSKYGEAIDTFEEFQRFLLDVERINPSHGDLVNPTILNDKILTKANNFHEQNDDYEIPTSIKYHQIAGWGLPTAYSVSYKSKNACDKLLGLICSKKKLVLSSDIKFSSGGDETVIAKSSLPGNGEEYYLNLAEYNEENKNRAHAGIFEVPEIFDLINNILRVNLDLPKYITKNTPSFVDYTVVKMRSPVSIDIYDKEGLHTGLLESGDDFNKIEENIPNSVYLEIGEDKYIIIPKEGEYKLKLTGLSDGIFTLELEDIINNTEGDRLLFRDISTTDKLRGEMQISRDSLLTLQIDNDSDGVFESTINASDLPQAGELEEDNNKNNKRSIGSIVQTPELSSEINMQAEKLSLISGNDKNQIDLNNKLEIQEETDGIKLTNQIKETPEDNNELLASTGFLAENKIQIMIAGLLIILLISLKYIYKVI